MTATLNETDDLTEALSKTFDNNVKARVDFFDTWLSREFAGKAHKTPNLDLKQSSLCGQTMRQAVESSDAGMKTVIHMCKPSRGA